MAPTRPSKVRSGLVAMVLAAAIGAPLAAVEHVVLVYRPEITSADVLIALEERFFEEAGIEVEALTWNGSTESLPVLAQGKIDFMTSGVFSAAYVNLIQRGARIRLVAARTMHRTGRCDYRAFVARTALVDSGRLEGLASIKGLRVSASRTASDIFYWGTLLEQAGLGFDDVVLNPVASNGLPVAFKRDLVDVAVLGEPLLSRVLATGEGKIWIPVNQLLPDRQNSYLLFGPTLLDRRPEVGRKIVAALRKAVQQFLDPARYERNVEIIARRTRSSAESVRAMCWPGWSDDGVIDRAQLEAFERWALGAGYIDAVVPAEKLVDDRFLPQTARTQGED